MVTIQDYEYCRTCVAPNTCKTFMCHNLGADETADSSIPSLSINGAYYQCGHQEKAKDTPVSSGDDATDIAWSATDPAGWFGDNTTGEDVKVKSPYDPCPDGYRVTSFDEWDYLRQNNTRSNIGTWTTGNSINSLSDVKFGEWLMLPIAGYRNNTNEILDNRGFHRYQLTVTMIFTIVNIIFHLSLSTIPYPRMLKKYKNNARKHPKLFLRCSSDAPPMFLRCSSDNKKVQIRYK
jgi:hypothetical protein